MSLLLSVVSYSWMENKSESFSTVRSLRSTAMSRIGRLIVLLERGEAFIHLANLSAIFTDNISINAFG